jgi:hypothetical protein
VNRRVVRRKRAESKRLHKVLPASRMGEPKKMYLLREYVPDDI